MAKWVGSGWISFHTEQGFRDLLLGAGFARVRWQELLPGFALVLAQRASLTRHATSGTAPPNRAPEYVDRLLPPEGTRRPARGVHMSNPEPCESPTSPSSP